MLKETTRGRKENIKRDNRKKLKAMKKTIIETKIATDEKRKKLKAIKTENDRAEKSYRRKEKETKTKRTKRVDRRKR